MKKALFIALALVGMQASVNAQDAETTTTGTPTTVAPQRYDDNNPGRGLYVSFGVAGNNGFKINDRLKADGMPALNKAAYESTIGYYIMFKKLSFDFEVSASYLQQKSAGYRVRNINTGFTFRGHYNIVTNSKLFVTAGADLTYLHNEFNLNNVERVIDLNNLDPDDYPGHINLYNDQFYAGPSAAFGFLQDSEYKLRLNVGYGWSVISGKWKSEYATVENTFRENGQGHYYAKLTIML